METREKQYDNWTSFIDYATTVERSGKYGNLSRNIGEMNFFGTATWDKAVTLMRGGWPEGICKARAISEPIERQLYSVIERASITYDVTGELLDVARYCAGEPEHWGNWTYDLVEGRGDKYIHIVINIGASWQVDQSVIIARGATIAALINLLELAGHRCKVTALSASGNRQESPTKLFTNRMMIKHYDEVLDLDRLTVAIAHPSTLRRMIFAIKEGFTDPKWGKEFGVDNSYGYSQNIPEAEQGDLYFGCMIQSEHMWNDPKQATQYVYNQLVKYGVIKPESI